MIDTNIILYTFWFTFAIVAMAVIWKQGRCIAMQDRVIKAATGLIDEQGKTVDKQKVLLQDCYDTMMVQEDILDEWELHGDYSEQRLAFLEGLTERKAYFYMNYIKPLLALGVDDAAH